MQMGIVAVVHSTNGTVTVGSCSIDVAKQMLRAEIPLTRCRDKNAVLTVSNSFAFQQTLP